MKPNLTWFDIFVTVFGVGAISAVGFLSIAKLFGWW